MTDRAVELVPLDELEPDPANPKEHDLGLLYTSLSRFGVADLPVVDGRTNLLVSGHGRRDALAMLRDAGMTPPSGVTVGPDGEWLVPVVTGWASKDDDEARAYLVAANRTVEAGGWDLDALSELLGTLAETDLATLDGIGYDADDLDDLRTRLAFDDATGGHGAEGNVFPTVDLSQAEDANDYVCPSCHYGWSGNPR